ncbi:DUF6112 family protein [Nesterenkonia sp. K-15-9-6]|uniref:DUF6112 family protein n=1 Tax=Nesterenkonia sp. K-15-9-6 TaxID=3093918 RepID=UPI004045110C
MSDIYAQGAGTVQAVRESDLPSPDFTGPWQPFVDSIAGMVIGTVIVVLVAAMVVGAILWAVGKFGQGGSRMQSNGLMVFLIGMVAAVLAGAAGGIVVYFFDVGPEWMNFNDTQGG